MLEQINEQVDCIVIYRKRIGAQPYKIRWNGKDYIIKKIGYHHRQKQGKVMFHIFSVASDNLDFRLRHDPESLTWTLEEVSDGLVN
jgi:hypothetical protein